MRIEPPAPDSQPPRHDDADAQGRQATRRLALLHDLSATLADADNARAVCALAAARLGRHTDELTFALAYLLHPDGRLARLAGAAGLAAGGPAAPVLMDLDEPPRAWQVGPERAIVLPVGAGRNRPAGFLVIGLLPPHEVNGAVGLFLELVAAQVSAAIVRAEMIGGVPVDDGSAWVRDTGPAMLDPLPDLPPTLRPGASPRPEAAGALPRVLVVDDNPDMRIYLHRLLQPLYEVSSAADGQAALDAVAKAEPELVISDTLMPRLDGFGLLAALRAEPATASLPVILLSARADDAARIASLEAGAADYLAKPFSPRELLARVAGTIAVGRVRRQALQRERELRAETVGVLESMTDAFIAVDPQWCITYVNRRAEQLLGMAREQLVGRNHWTLFPEAIGTPAEHEIRRAMATRVSVKVEHDVARDGRWFEISAFPIRRGGLAVFGRDITARRMAQAALLRADRRKDEFLATLAHELRNPLAPIRSALQLLRRPGSTLDAASLYAMMERQVDHIVRLVDDLLEVARITEGKIELRRAPLDLADVIARAVETCRTQIEAAGHVLVLDLPQSPLPVHADAVRLSQVFANLLNNAAKYTESGGRIEVGARLDGDTIETTVSDNGVGIRAEMLPHVFDLFTQADDAGRHSQGGLGIGLTLVRSLVEMHGGTVQAHSEGMMAGSRFIVRLARVPVPADTAPSPSAVAAEPAPALSPAAPARRVLVVDDNADAAEGVALVLQFLGVQTHVVNDGAAALAALDSFRPHLVLLDLGMPGLDGYDVARWIRQRDSHAGTRIVALTGWGDSAERARTMEAGFDAHLVKPVDFAALQALLGRGETPAPA